MTIGMLLSMAGLLGQSPTPPPGDDWDLAPIEGGVTATLAFSGNFNVGVLCSDRVLSVVIGGLEPSTGSRRLKVAIGEEPEAIEGWVADQTGRFAFSTHPASEAREMRAGGMLRITLVDGDADGRQYAYELPRSDASVDAVLMACDVPLNDIRYDRPPFPLSPQERTWTRVPQSQFPSAAARANVRTGRASLSCLVSSTGETSDCVVESEAPRGMGFGEAAVRGARSGRIDMSGADPEGAPYLVRYTTSFRIQ